MLKEYFQHLIKFFKHLLKKDLFTQPLLEIKFLNHNHLKVNVDQKSKLLAPPLNNLYNNKVNA